MTSPNSTRNEPTSLYHSLPREERRQLIVDRFMALGSQALVAREVGCSESVVSRQLNSAQVVRVRATPPKDGSAAPLDVELTSMRRMWEALMPLSQSQRERVLRQTLERCAEERKPAGSLTHS